MTLSQPSMRRVSIPPCTAASLISWPDALQDVPPELRCHRHDFIEALPALHAHAVTLVTAATLEERQLTDLRMQSDALQNRRCFRRGFGDRIVQRFGGEPQLTQCGVAADFGAGEVLIARVILLLAARADAPDESLRDHQVQR